MWLPGFEFPSVLIYESRCLPSFLSQPVGLHGAGRRWTETSLLNFGAGSADGWHQDAVADGVSEWCEKMVWTRSAIEHRQCESRRAQCTRYGEGTDTVIRWFCPLALQMLLKDTQRSMEILPGGLSAWLSLRSPPLSPSLSIFRCVGISQTIRRC